MWVKRIKDENVSEKSPQKTRKKPKTQLDRLWGTKGSRQARKVCLPKLIVGVLGSRKVLTDWSRCFL